MLSDHAADVIEASYGPIAAEGRRTLGRWSDADRAVIGRFLRAGIEFQHRHAVRIRGLA